MLRCIQLAKNGFGTTYPNPLVGSVIVHESKIIGEGWHYQSGKPHAEVNAINSVKNTSLLSKATIYVNLEPCSHTGKTPPCVQAIINSGVKKVIISTLDPNPLVSGKGVDMLKNTGIEVLSGLLEYQACEQNRGFIKRMKTGLPFVTCKIAMSLDGKTSMSSGESKWITSDSARVDVQKLRSKHQAVMTGSGTILADNPLMTVRLEHLNTTPLRVVIDGKDKVTDKALNIFSKDAPTQVFNSKNTKLNRLEKLDLQDILTQLGTQDINSVLLEAGPGLVGAMIEENLIDEFVI